MNVLMLSEDPKIMETESDVSGRMREYADVLGELHIVVTGRGTAWHEGNLFIYPATLRSLGVFMKGWNLCRKVKFDIITAQAADDIGCAAFFLSRRFTIPFQMQIHTDVLSPWYRHASWKEYIQYITAKLLIPRADYIRVVSERIKRSILESGIRNNESEIVVLPIWTEYTKFFEIQRNPDTDKRFEHYSFTMIAVGRFVEKEKNFLMLIDVMREFITVCPKALLVIAGEGPDKKNYELRIKNYGLEKNVLLESWRNDLSSFYKSFDLFLFSSNYEGWGRVALEAMASGLPVVMTDVGLAGEVVKNEENGVVVPVEDRDAFLRAVEDVYKHQEKRQKLADAGTLAVGSLMPRTKEEYLERYKKSFEIPRKADMLKQ